MLQISEFYLQQLIATATKFLSLSWQHRIHILKTELRASDIIPKGA